MSRSRKKHPFSAIAGGSMKPWRQSVNQVHRHRAKQLINTCRDFDRLLLPTKDETGNLYDSPRDGKMRWQEKPLINDCEWEEFRWQVRYGNSRLTFNGREHYEKTGHHLRCNCYGNKRGWYWKMLRK
jgi:hypothetical protein